MSEFNPKRESIEEILDYNVAISEAENGAEQRRLIHANAVIGFRVELPAMTYTQQKVYRDYFVGKYGALTSFTMTNPFDNVEYTVRFVPGSFTTKHEKGFFKTSFELVRVL